LEIEPPRKIAQSEFRMQFDHCLPLFAISVLAGNLPRSARWFKARYHRAKAESEQRAVRRDDLPLRNDDVEIGKLPQRRLSIRLYRQHGSLVRSRAHAMAVKSF